MTVSVCIASRGRKEMLRQTLRSLIDGMALPETQIVVALDQDDADGTVSVPFPPRERVLWSIAPREDSLGAKYNRAQQARRADLYVLWADDMVMPDAGWDTKLTVAAAHLPDNCGVVFFGSIPGILQPGIAVTHKFVEAMGFFNVPYFPFWWHDTWIMEIATMCDRYIHADVRVELLDITKGTSRGVREITFWAELFDRLRPSRRAVAEKIIRTPERKAELLARLPAIEAQWLHSNSVLRDPVRAAQLETHYSFDAPADERYLRLKAKAETMLKELA